MKHDRIEVNPDVMMGKPVVKGTRLTVEHIMRELDDGMTVVDILEAHPRPPNRTSKRPRNSPKST